MLIFMDRMMVQCYKREHFLNSDLQYDYTNQFVSDLFSFITFMKIDKNL